MEESREHKGRLERQEKARRRESLAYRVRTLRQIYCSQLFKPQAAWKYVLGWRRPGRASPLGIYEQGYYVRQQDKTTRETPQHFLILLSRCCGHRSRPVTGCTDERKTPQSFSGSPWFVGLVRLSPLLFACFRLCCLLLSLSLSVVGGGVSPHLFSRVWRFFFFFFCLASFVALAERRLGARARDEEEPAGGAAAGAAASHGGARGK